MKNPLIAAVLNFFFMGLGYLYNGKRTLLGAGFTIAALALTYVEFQLSGSTYWIMFVAVFLANTCFAIDGYNEAKEISSPQMARA